VAGILLLVTKSGITSQSSDYEAPALILHGSVADLTQALLIGPIHDGGFPSGAAFLSINGSL
jgi:hypothetical protein